jgi:23S rRNA (adenine2503-C2)-methyltransferase
VIAAFDLLRAAGARPVHLERALRAWLAGERLAVACADARPSFPAAARSRLADVDRRLDALAAVEAEHAGAHGGARLVLRLADGRAVESVLLPRDGVCVSTQVGCAVGCAFCCTGLGGLERQLAAEEILAQVVQARRRRRLRRVVFMGMGEPLHNLDAVLAAVSALGGPGGFGHKDLVVSTVGEPRAFERLDANGVRPALALSLHATDRALRERLLPRAPRVDPLELVDAACGYAERTGHPLQLQWTLIAGVNDGEGELVRLARRLRGRRVVVNLIPYNAVEGLAHEPPPLERSRALVRALMAEGVLAKLRLSVAGDVDGACGQLRSRAQPA